MPETHIESNPVPGAADPTRRLMFEAARRADAMGIADEDRVQEWDLPAVRRLAERARAAGIGRTPAAALADVETSGPGEVDTMLRLLITALEQSPVPQFEWPSVSRVFEPEQLAQLLGISVSSLR